VIPFLITGSHDSDLSDFRAEFKPIVIHNKVWLGTRVTILPGVTIHEGAVVAAGALSSQRTYLPIRSLAGTGEGDQITK